MEFIVRQIVPATLIRIHKVNAKTPQEALALINAKLILEVYDHSEDVTHTVTDENGKNYYSAIIN
jgi:hypothetical protein